MRCPACAGDNVPDAKFCGSCGFRLNGRTSTELSDDGVGARTPLSSTLDRAPLSTELSYLAPGRGGGRAMKIFAVLVLDVALVGAGAWLLRGGGDHPDPDEESAPASAPLADGAVSSTPIDAAGPQSVPERAMPPAAPHAPVAPAPDPPPPPPRPVARDAGAARAIDAAPPVDAPALLDEIDAGEPVDAPTAVASAPQIASHLAKLVTQSSGRLTRCYEQATKALPPEQPLIGEVDIGLAVLPSGAGSHVRILRNSTGSDDLARCVLAIAEAWSYPAHTEAEPIEFVRSFRFGAR